MKVGTIVKRFWGLILVPPALFGIYTFPGDWGERNALKFRQPWSDLVAMVSRESLLWALAIFLFLWLAWTELRPFIRDRWRKFPPQHARILGEIADGLSKIEQVTTTKRANALAPDNEEMRGRVLHAYYSERMRVERLSNQIAYDMQTVQTLRDYVQLCGTIMDDEFLGHDNRDDRALLSKLRGPVFHALHAGKSINRKSLPLADWMDGEAGVSRKRLDAVLKALGGK